MAKKTKVVSEAVPETPEEEVVVEKVEKVSPAKAAFLHLIELYKVQNPVKYEKKKAELERKLAAIE